MQHPYDFLERLRADGPAHNLVFPHGAKVWLVTGYADVRRLLSDPRVSKDGRRANELFARHSGMIVEAEADPVDLGFDDELTSHLLNSDPPRHTRLRGLLGRELTAKRMEGLRPRLAEVVDGLLNALDDGRPVVDLVAGLTQPLPIIAICELLGVAAEDAAVFQGWATELVGAGHAPEVVEAASNNVLEYAKTTIAAKQANPGDDLISALVHGSGEDGDRLSYDELVGMFFLLVIAGYSTTTHSLTNFLFSLLTHPEEMAKLGADPALMHAAVDELMRYDGGVGVATFRFTKEEITLGEVTIPAGEILALSLSSAGRDSTRYPDPDRLDLNRRPNGVLGFGHGPHYCIGAPLARIQSEILLTTLLTRFPNLRLAADPDALEWENSPLLRGLLTLPVSLH
ncbi:MAG: cytochrome P450 [Jatrophihabitantaceae bacterium]